MSWKKAQFDPATLNLGMDFVATDNGGRAYGVLLDKEFDKIPMEVIEMVMSNGHEDPESLGPGDLARHMMQNDPAAVMLRSTGLGPDERLALYIDMDTEAFVDFQAGAHAMGLDVRISALDMTRVEEHENIQDWSPMALSVFHETYRPENMLPRLETFLEADLGREPPKMGLEDFDHDISGYRPDDGMDM